MEEYGFNTPLSPIRFQSQLGKEMKRMYKEGSNLVRLSLARVTKVNYKYNTVEVITTLHKNTTMKNPNDNGRYSARLPVTFGGRTPDGKVYGSNTLVTVGSLVLIGFLEGNKDHPIVLNIYGDSDNQSQLTRTTLTSADESDEAIQRELWQLFTLYPSMTYQNIDGRGNKEVTFAGKSFMFITDTDPENDYVNDAEFDYDHLPSSRYANGELIEPVSPDSPTVLYVHQGVYDKHRVTFFIKSDGTVRLGSRHLDGKGITFQELKTDGSVGFVQKKDTTNPEEESKVFSKIGIEANGNILLQTPDHTFEINPDGIFYDGKPLFSAGGGDSVIGDILSSITDLSTTITVMDGKIESKISKTTYDVDLQSIRDYAKGLSDGVQKEVDDLNGEVAEMNGYVDGSFKDGIIEESESKAIATYINTLNKEKADLDAKYTEIYNNTYLSGATKNNLEAAKTDYDNKHEQLITSVQVAIADSRATAEETAAVDNNFVLYSTSLAALRGAFETAINVITAEKTKEAEDNAKEHTDGKIEIVNSTITQLADEISLKVDSETYTNAIENIESTKATKEETQAIDDRLATAEVTIEDTIENIPYRIEIKSTNGLVFKNGDIDSVVYAKVYRGKDDVTATFASANFVWHRISDDADGDAAWDASHIGIGNAFTVTPDDVPGGHATFECDLDIPDA
jgi:hypothetical protein